MRKSNTAADASKVIDELIVADSEITVLGNVGYCAMDIDEDVDTRTEAIPVLSVLVIASHTTLSVD